MLTEEARNGFVLVNSGE